MNKKVKLGLKIAGASVGWIPASVLVLAQIDVPTSLNTNAPLNKTFFRDTVKGKAAAEEPITNIAMIGSHDSLSDDIYMMSKMDPYSPNNTTLSEIAKYVGQGAMVRLSRAQSDNIYTQLNAGVRYIDARITCINGKYYTHHTMISNTLEHYLLQILQWLDENPGEFVFFHIYYFNYDGIKLEDKTSSEYIQKRDKAWEDLGDYIKTVKYNNKSLFDYDTTLAETMAGTRESCSFGDISYNDITNNGKNAGAVIFFSSDDTKEGKAGEWYTLHDYYDDGSDKYLYNPCALKMKSTEIVDFINNTSIPKVKNMSILEKAATLRYLQAQTTPNFDEIGEIVTSWSLIQKAHDHNDYILNHSGLNFTDPSKDDCVFKYFPIFMCDNITCNDNGFCQKIVDCATAYNKTLN